jgi:hypothetical protein
VAPGLADADAPAAELAAELSAALGDAAHGVSGRSVRAWGAPARYTASVDRSRLPTRTRRLGEEEEDGFVAGLSPAERIALVWPLTLQAWAFLQGTEDEPRLRRHVVRVVRGGR